MTWTEHAIAPQLQQRQAIASQKRGSLARHLILVLSLLCSLFTGIAHMMVLFQDNTTFENYQQNVLTGYFLWNIVRWKRGVSVSCVGVFPGTYSHQITVSDPLLHGKEINVPMTHPEARAARTIEAGREEVCAGVRSRGSQGPLAADSPPLSRQRGVCNLVGLSSMGKRRILYEKASAI